MNEELNVNEGCDVAAREDESAPVERLVRQTSDDVPTRSAFIRGMRGDFFDASGHQATPTEDLVPVINSGIVFCEPCDAYFQVFFSGHPTLKSVRYKCCGDVSDVSQADLQWGDKKSAEKASRPGERPTPELIIERLETGLVR